MNTRSVTILGDGGWGSAIAMVLAEKELEVRMWGHSPAYLAELERTRSNRLFLPGVRLPARLLFEPDIDKAMAAAGLIIVAIPSKFLRSCLQRASACSCAVVSLTKGIEQGTLKRPSEIIRECLGARSLAVLSGPSHSEEVACRLPATVTVAAEDQELARNLQELFMTPALRVYTSPDVIGVELGGALKNVIALAAGIATGLGLGDNALAALITRGLAEITRLGVALGAQPETFAGLSGMGDLVVTCISAHGRNRAVGLELARGRTLASILADRATVAEGLTTALSAYALAEELGVEMPITRQVVEIINKGKDPRKAVAELMTREGRAE